MTAPREAEILQALRAVRDPDLGRDIVDLGFVKDVKECGGAVSFTIELTTPACPVREQLREQARRAVARLPGIEKVDVKMTSQVRETRSEARAQLVPKVKNIVPVASGKGGVGKSTVSVNLALALSKLGARVGLMDADIYGPSVPHILGAEIPPRPGEGGRILPSMAHGLKVISMAFFSRPDEATIWRGPMLHKMIEQFLGVVEWDELDYLVVDLPPGTGDVQLSLCQMIPLTGAAVVSTPQDVALRVAEKAILMFRKLKTPVLGIVENMSGFVCPGCGRREEIFGSGGAERYSLEHGIPFLGAIPLATEVRSASDAGRPTVLSAPDSPAGRAFTQVAENLAAQVSVQHLGSATDMRPARVEIVEPERDRLRIVWADGHESVYAWFDLRANCPCASCVHELTGERLLRREEVAKDVRSPTVAPVGRYALHFQFSDGHTSGIYTFDLLRKLCPCPLCTAR